jgi:endonuclease YncB( thermonuclease family)
MILAALTLLVVLLISVPAFATDFPNVTYHRCYDGDTCTFTLPGIHPLFGEKISVRIAGIDTPEIRGKCDQEKTLVKEARDVVRGILQKAHRINLLEAERGKYFDAIKSRE